jgi:UDP-N-acetylmuramoyl-tripeptide--D-alanyl-D-alanine ligase
MNISELYDLYLAHPFVQTDTRKLKKGDLFFALKGDNFNGNQFAQYALENGASYVIIDELSPSLEGNSQVIIVENVLTTLHLLALHHRKQFHIPFIGITGSNGKTTTKELIWTVLSTKYKTYATFGNLNNHIGVPLTILSVPKDAEIAIIEMGANHIGEIASYCDIAMPNFGIINNCGKAHLEGFGSLAGVKQAKGELYDYLRNNEGTIFINKDLDYLIEMAHDIPHQISYGTANAQIIGKNISDSAFLQLAILTNGLETVLDTKLIGAYNLPNVLAAVTVGNYFNINIDDIKAAISNYTPTNSRSQLIVTTKNNQVILDAYNANPSSMELALLNFEKMEGDNKLLLLGAMKEMGDVSDIEHERIIKLCKELGFKDVYLVGHEFKTGINDPAFPLFEDSLLLTQQLAAQNINNRLILIKGSRGSKMEATLAAL